MRGRAGVGFLLCVAVLASAAFAVPAYGQGTPPWAGGLDVVSPFEKTTGQLLSEIAKHPVQVFCTDEADWSAVAGVFGFNPSYVWGIVPLNPSTGTVASYTLLAPRTCFYTDQFWLAADKRAQKLCQVGTRTEYRTEYRTESRTEYRTEYRTKTYRVKTRKRVRVSGKWRWKTVTVTRTRRVEEQIPVQVDIQVPVQVPHQVPVNGVCQDWLVKLISLEVFTHEAMHLFGIRDEALAECYGMQLLPWFVWKLGATTDFAREIGNDYWAMVYPLNSPEYSSADCRDGGPLDLNPGNSAWPRALDPGSNPARVMQVLRSAASDNDSDLTKPYLARPAS